MSYENECFPLQLVTNMHRCSFRVITTLANNLWKELSTNKSNIPFSLILPWERAPPFRRCIECIESCWFFLLFRLKVLRVTFNLIFHCGTKVVIVNFCKTELEKVAKLLDEARIRCNSLRKRGNQWVDD